MTGYDGSFGGRRLYVELRRTEIEAQMTEIRRARQVVPARRLRHRLGTMLISVGEALAERRREPICAEQACLPVARHAGHGGI